MKLSKTILAALALSALTFYEANSQCDNSAIDCISANKIKAAVCTGGDFFWDRSDGKFIVPYVPGKSPETSTFYAAGLWLGGFDAGGNLKTACQVYGNANGIADFWAGPIDDSSHNVLPDGCEKFNHVWKTNRASILQVIEDFEDNGIIDSELPPSILKWPAKGNPHFEVAMGFALPDQELAPFFDRNGNDLFEPLNGEFPIIGQDFQAIIPDELTWTVFNDVQDNHLETGGAPLGVEVHFMTFAFNCSDNEVLNYTVFTRHKVFNKSAEDLFNFRTAIGADIDIGCFNDDYFGCDTILNTAYLYNKDNNDTDTYCPNVGVYGENPPVQTVTFLNQKLEKLSVHYDLSSIDPPPSLSTMKPTVDFEFYNLLNGRWRDGTPITFGNSGYDTSSTEFVNHLFFDNPNNQLGWSQRALHLPDWEPNIVMSFGLDTLSKGNNVVLDAAYSYHRQPDSNFIGNVNVALTNVTLIQDFYENGLISSCSQSLFCQSDCVWPGDANNDGVVKNDDLLYLGIGMGNNANGPARAPASIIWSPNNAESWNQSSGMIDQKHQDCNGDGTVSELDWHIIETNYGEHRPNYSPIETLAPYAQDELYLDINKAEIYTSSTTLQRTINAKIFIGTQATPINELYGLSFTIKYDTSIWEKSPGLSILNLKENSPLGNSNEVMVIEKVFPNEGRIEVAISRKDGAAFSNVFGEIGNIRIALKENAATGNPNGMQNLFFQFYDADGIDGQDSIFQLGATSDIVVGKDMAYDSTLTYSPENQNSKFPLTISPNPTNGTFDLYFDKTSAPSKVSLFDFNGKNILSEEIPKGFEQHRFNLSGQLPSGIYVVKWTLADGRFTARKLILK